MPDQAKRAAVPKFVLLDRDGVINARVPDGYVTAWDQFVFLPRALEAMSLLAKWEYACLIVSNQACVGRGLLTRGELDEITRRFVVEVESHGGRIDGVYYCLHRKEDGCRCRKPEPGLLLEAQKKHGFSFRETFLIGDSETDWQAGQRVNCPVLLVGNGNRLPGSGADGSQCFPNLHAAAEFIIARP